jgi:hypothetical protein
MNTFKKTPKEIIDQIINDLKTANAEGFIMEPLDTPDDDACQMDFEGISFAELGWDPTPDNKWKIYLVLCQTPDYISPGRLDDNAWHQLLEIATEQKWAIFAEMEQILDRTFSEITNSDACSFAFEFKLKPNELDHYFEFTVEITNFLS